MKTEKEEIEGKLQSQDIDRSKYLFGVQYILELARTAYSLYSQRDMTGRREIILFLLSNFLFKRGNLSPVYKKPFSILTKMRVYPIESGRLDSNQRPLSPEPSALTRLSYAPKVNFATLSLFRCPTSAYTECNLYPRVSGLRF